MALSDLTRPSVITAIAEFDALGRDEFLRRYGFGKARGYYLEHDGKTYDSKAIAGAAPTPFLPSGMSGPGRIGCGTGNGEFRA